MKKIMFSDKYGLTKAVLEGRKTQTRRICKIEPIYKNTDIAFPVGWKDEDNPEKDPLYGAFCWVNKDNPQEHTTWVKPAYKVGEIVAVAQSYEDISNIISKTPSKERAEFYCDVMKAHFPNSATHKDYDEIAGWYNKMFVKSSLMIHRIRITKVRLERLQDISDEDCMAEGIIKWDAGQPDVPFFTYPNAVKCDYDTPQDAYASLIDKVGKKGDWESNPYVFVYDFELVK